MACSCEKPVYVSRPEAVDIARRATRGKGPPKRPYRCPDDPKLWHLSTMSKKQVKGR